MYTYPHGTELVTPSCDQTSDSTVPGYGTGEARWCWDQWCCCSDESLTHLADPCFQAPCFQAPQTHTPSHQTLQKWETSVSQSHPTPSKSYELLQFHKYIAWWIESSNLLTVSYEEKTAKIYNVWKSRCLAMQHLHSIGLSARTTWRLSGDTKLPEPLHANKCLFIVSGSPPSTTSTGCQALSILAGARLL